MTYYKNRNILKNYIVLEGVDMVGKSTILKGIKEAVKDNKNIIITSEPSTFIKHIIKRIIKGKIAFKLFGFLLPFLFYIDRLFHIRKVKSWLKKGYTVYSDRSFISSIVYQGSIGRFLNRNMPLPKRVYLIRLRKQYYEKRYNKNKNPDNFESDFMELHNKGKYYEYILKLFSHNNSEFSFHSIFNETKDDLRRAVRDILPGNIDNV